MASTVSCDHYVVLLNWAHGSGHSFPPAVLLSPSLFLTARLEEGSKVQIFSLHGKLVNRDASFLPSLRDAREAGCIRLREIFRAPVKSVQPGTLESGKRRDWLAILLHEHLGEHYLLSYRLLSLAC